MPTHYTYTCARCGHTERRYRNSIKCRECGGPIERLAPEAKSTGRAKGKWLCSFWLAGQPPRKSNSRKIVKAGGRTRVIKSAEARRWVQSALLRIPAEAKLGLGSAERPLRILFEVFYESKRPDLSIELVLDTLEEAGVISNDRHVYEYTAKKFFSRERPGVMVHIGHLEEKRD